MYFRTSTRVMLCLATLCLTTLCLTLAAWTAPASAAEGDGAEAKAEKLFQDGRKALLQGRNEAAIKLLRDAVTADESGAKTTYRLNLARAYRYADQPQEAGKLLAAILKKTPDHVEAGQLLAEIHYANQKWKEVESVLKPLLQYRHDYTSYHLLAEATFNLNKHQDAREYYKEAIKLNPSSAPDHYQLANIYLSEDRLALAANAYEQAIKLGLDSAVLHYKLASAYFNLRNYFGRVSVIKVASGSTGEVSGDWYLIEPVPGAKDKFRAAPKKSAIYQIAAAIDRGMETGPDVQMLLANTYLNARRYKQAYELYTKIGETAPEEDRGLHHYYFAQSALGVGKYDEYLEHLRQAVKLDPEAYQSALVDAFLNVADKHNQAGDLERYIEYLNAALQQNPLTSSLHLRLADAYDEARRYDKAIQQWRMVLDLEPDHPKRTELLNLIKMRATKSTAPGTKATEAKTDSPAPKQQPPKTSGPKQG